jgi:hypothetical protein
METPTPVTVTITLTLTLPLHNSTSAMWSYNRSHIGIGPSQSHPIVALPCLVKVIMQWWYEIPRGSWFESSLR